MKDLYLNFKNKYKTLVKPVSWNNKLEKVPGKEIYFYDGDAPIDSKFMKEN
jgi:hypothetical protein